MRSEALHLLPMFPEPCVLEYGWIREVGLVGDDRVRAHHERQQGCEDPEHGHRVARTQREVLARTLPLSKSNVLDRHVARRLGITCTNTRLRYNTQIESN